jgi:N-acetyl-anhydromuramyl-L-alanine amidase AmpD
MNSTPVKKRTILVLLLFTAISHILFSQNELNIVNKNVQFGMRTANDRNISAIIIHSTFNNSGGEKYDIDLVIKQFARYGVSSHYVIGRDGTVFRLVDEKNVAFHAGKSQLPNGQTNVNSVSIGIELITSFDETPTDEQIHALILLTLDIKTRYQINYILRHSDIAPDRKTDPWNMNWDDFLSRIQH